MSSIIESKFISSNANTVLKCADYSKRAKCFAFGSSNLIHLYSPSKCKTFLTLNHHTDRVNGVKWIDNNKEEGNELMELISIGGDAKIVHWVNVSQDKNPFDANGWKMEREITTSDKNKSVSINLVDTLYVSPFEKYITTFTSNGILDIFYFDIDLNEFKLFASLDYKRKLQDALCLTVLNEDYLLLLSGGYDSVVNVHTVMRIKKMNKEVIEKKEVHPLEYKVSLTGHSNDIRDIAAISPITHNSDMITFCSCSQDNYIRTWNVTKLKENEYSSMADKVNVNKTNSIFDEYKSKTSYVIKVETNIEKKEYEYYNITLDSVLSGHEDSVSSVKWEKINDTYAILSSSFDFTVAIWSFDKKHNIWNKEHTLGEMSGNRHAFFYATFLNDYKEVLAYAYNGALYLWKLDEKENQYKNQLITHGHFGPVTDLTWDPTCNIVFSCSEDETTRAFAYWKNNDTWHEINRPQIHGYEINTLVCCPQNIDNNKDENLICKIISGADEKLIRVFTPPFNIVKFVNELSNKQIKFKADNTNDFYEKKYSNVEGSKQALGLMNRQVVLDAPQNDDSNPTDYGNFDPDAVLTNKTEQFYISKYNYSLPPNEDFLSNNTLWPEESKLYGHGSEVFALAISHNSKYLASSQKAQTEKNAQLYLWNTQTKKLIDKLSGHNLTIVQIEFSPNDEYILTASRDRGWCIYKFINDKNSYEKMQYAKNAHKRIIWGISWNKDSNAFVTVSRDKTIIIWEKENESSFVQKSNKEFNDAVTSVDWIKAAINEEKDYLICGFESGEMKICEYNKKEKKIELIHEFNKHLQHGKSVRRIKSVIREDTIIIASCGEDNSVRIFEIKKDNIEKINNVK